MNNIYEKALQYEQEGRISIRKHPVEDLYILNYTKEEQFSNNWDDFTLQCRGLIINSKGEIKSLPFPKFFNYEEIMGARFEESGLKNFREHLLKNIQNNVPFEVSEKVDGSLGIVHFINGVPYIATRGSFESEQAIEGTKILHEKYLEYFCANHDMFEDKTILVEIVYPENSIVVQYGDERELYLLDIIDNIKNISIDYEKVYPNIPLKKTMKFSYENIEKLHEFVKNPGDFAKNKEGFVVKFSDGFRVKMKFEEYCNLHRIITGLSEKSIWEHLKSRKLINELLFHLPEEHQDWVINIANDITSNYNSVIDHCWYMFETIDTDIFSRTLDATRKEYALEFIKYPKIKSGLFMILDDNLKQLEEWCWEQVKPKTEIT